MKQKLLNNFRLRAIALVALLCAAFTGAWADTKTDVLTASDLAATSNTYTDFSGVTKTSDAVYAGNSAKDSSGNIQMRSKNSNSGIVTTTSGGKVKSVKISVGSGSNTIDVYGSNTAYTAASDLYGSSSSQGTKIGSLTATGTITFNDDYEYVGIRSNNGAIYLSSVEIVWETAGGGGTPTCDTPTFSPAAGTYTSAQNVTISTTTTGATIYYTTDGTTPTTNSNTYSSAIPVSTNMTIKAMATATGYDNSSVAEATYSFVNLVHAGTSADPYTVADARTAIDANTGMTDVYATGIVSAIVTAYDSGFGNITFDIIDEEGSNTTLRAYRCGGTDAENVAVGDIVVISGNLTLYNSIYEFAQGCTLVSLTHTVATTPAINADNVEIEYDATSSSIDFTVNNETQDGALTAAITAGNDGSWLSLGAVTTSVPLTCSANEGNTDRTATVTLTYTYNTNETVTKDVTVTQKHFVADYAALPFTFTSGKAAIESTDGITESGLGNDYGDTNAPLKFDNTGDYLILKINERPGTLTFNIKNNSFSGGTFKLQTSEDGTNYTDHKSYTDISGTQSEEINDLGENVRYIKWIYTYKSSGNVGLGNIALAAYIAPINHNLTVTLSDNISAIYVFDAADQNVPLIEDGAAGTVQVIGGTEILVSPDVVDGYQLETLTVDGNDVTSEIDDSGAYTFTMPGHAVTITATATQSSVSPTTSTSCKYVKVTSTGDITDGQYLIVYENGGLAFNGNLETLDATSNTIAVTINNSEIAVTDETTAAEFIIDAAAGTIQSKSGYYIGQTSDANGLQTSDETAYTNTLSIDGENADIVSSGGAYLRYNSASNQLRFRYYKSSSYTGQQAIQLYKKVESVTIGELGYATLFSQHALDFSAVTGLTAYTATVEGSTVTLNEVDDVPENTGVVLKGTTGSYSVPVINSSSTEQGALEGNASAATAWNAFSGYTLYVLAQAEDYPDHLVQFRPVNEGSIAAGKAFLKVTTGTLVKSFNVVFGGEDGIESVKNGQLTMDNEAIYNLNGQRVNKAVKGIYIQNGKKFIVK